jgi:pimeloyl-ACP methyl ester carboxylesterase
MAAAELPAKTTHHWTWRGHAIRYQTAGASGSAVVLIHGFGASSDHWRHNIEAIARDHRVFALDLIGFGQSAKPRPSETLRYTFETWGEQINDFCSQIVQAPVFLVGNSIGCIAALQAAVQAPEQVLGVIMLNCSLRLLHDRKRASLPWYRRLSAPLLQTVLTNRAIGHYFFNRLARPNVIRKILTQAYARPETVTDELVALLLKPAMDVGAADVFLAFTAYSQGPLPEDLLPQLQCPAVILWGAADPWEPVELGRELAAYPKVEGFIVLDGVGHCPQDEAPDQVNPLIIDWLAQHEPNQPLLRH